MVTETYSSRLVAYNYTITPYFPNQWKFDFNSYFQCPNDSFVSIRGPNRVCISVRVFQSPNFCQVQAAGAELCQQNRGIGLTGPYSLAEADVIGRLLIQKSIEEPADSQYKYINYWIDGTRATQWTFNVTDETLNGTTGYRWESNLGSAPEKNCSFIVNFYSVSIDVYVYASLCYATKQYGSWCQRGAVCRTQPISDL